MDFIPDASQLILPTDKRNPSFSVYLSDDGLFLSVFYGLELLEVIPNEPEHPAFKMMVGRLYNARVRVASLEDVFDADRKTIRSWGQAILSRDPSLLERVLLGRSMKQKRTQAIDNYVVRRWDELRAEGRPDYRATLAREVFNLFEVTLCGETIRQIIASHKGEGAAGLDVPVLDASADASAPCPSAATGAPVAPPGDLASDTEAPPPPPPPSPPPQRAPDLDLGETTCSAPATTASCDLAAPAPQPPSCEEASSLIIPGQSSAEASKCSPPNAFPSDLSQRPGQVANPPPSALRKWDPQPGEAMLCDHVGMLIFAAALGTIANATDVPEPLLAQWLACILLGAINVEQTKYLNWGDLRALLGQTLRHTAPQREALTRLASPETIDAVLRWNCRQLALPPEAGDFYYDPHTAHYTGQQNVLKGWCANIRWADKLINSDYVHSAAGQPIYFECTDNYDDLRARFLPLVARMRASLRWPAERVLSFVVDRGIYSNDVFNDILQNPAVHFITWEKGWQGGTPEAWEALVAEHRKAGTHGEHIHQRQRNSARDQRAYRFSYIHRPWAANPALRQIVVRATNPKGKTIELSILSDDTTRPSSEVVRLMFNRWVQENDFKYLDKHFGINELTSYRSTPYEQLRDELTDRQIPSHAYVEKVKHGRKLTAKKARQLLLADQARRNEEQRQRRIAELQQAPADEAAAEGVAGAQGAKEAGAQKAEPAPSPRDKELRQLRNASKRHEKYHRERTAKIEGIQKEMEGNERAKGGIEREVSRIDELIRQEMVRMDLGNKTLMDALKISARNLFYGQMAPFKEAYDNYRDDHDHYRELTRSDGVLRWTGQEIEVHLVAQVNYPPKLQRIISAHLAGLNARGLSLPDGSGRPLRLKLTAKERLSVRISEAPEF